MINRTLYFSAKITKENKSSMENAEYGLRTWSIPTMYPFPLFQQMTQPEDSVCHFFASSLTPYAVNDHAEIALHLHLMEFGVVRIAHD